jgi:hypothetical protein
MAKKEHDLWMAFYKENGWDYAQIKNNYTKKHQCLVPFGQLKEEDKAKDREIVSKYPVIVDKAGFGIAKL